MSKESNSEAQQRFGEAVISGRLDRFDALVATRAVDNDPGLGQVAGPEGYKALFGEMRIAFPDLHIEVEQLVADENRVAFAYTVTGRGGPGGQLLARPGLRIFLNGRRKIFELHGPVWEAPVFMKLSHNRTAPHRCGVGLPRFG